MTPPPLCKSPSGHEFELVECLGSGHDVEKCRHCELVIETFCDLPLEAYA